MNQTLARLLALLVPTRPGRRWCRAVLEYGVFRAIKTSRFLKREKDTPTQYYLTVCAIAKNEGAYFEEWIEWHKALGVDKFFIYDNESDDNTKEVLAPYIESGLVEYIFYPGKKKQIPSYNDCLDRHRLDARWIAFIDMDEFIVPIKDKSITEFMKRFEEFSAVEINLLYYGSGGAKKKEPGKVMDRFKRHAPFNHYLNKHAKSIANPRRVIGFISSNEVAKYSGLTANSRGEPMKEPRKKREPILDVIRINHYPIKSWEEFLVKRAAGRVCNNKRRLKEMENFEYFKKMDQNDLLDEREYNE